MSALQMLGTSLLLGLFVLLAGFYGVLYCLGRLRANRRLRRAAVIAYLLQGITACLLALTPLDFWWKALLLASFLAYLPIPPITWRFLELLHEPEEQRS
jgi:predicted MFS family arabinose efflux permease